jgi:hypothetical protein
MCKYFFSQTSVQVHFFLENRGFSGIFVKIFACGANFMAACGGFGAPAARM